MPAMKVLLWPITGRQALRNMLADQPDLTLVPVTHAGDLAGHLPGAQAAILSGREYDADVAAAFRAQGGSLRLLQFLTAGYEGAVLHGVPPRVAVCNAGDAYSSVVAEHVLTLLLSMIRRMPVLFEQQRQRRWDRAVRESLDSLDGKTVAVLGFGGIGREVAKRARAFGCRILVVTRRARPEPEADEVHGLDALHPVLRRANAVVVALPLMPETQGLLGRAAFAACREGALLVNVARGGLVDQAALLEALEAGQLGGAALDVTTPEPLPAESPLWLHPRVIISPHLGGVGSEAGMQRLAELVCDNVLRLRDGRPLRHQVIGREQDA
jgi:phosphoglycerate dehydrogenase-like enzyme